MRKIIIFSFILFLLIPKAEGFEKEIILNFSLKDVYFSKEKGYDIVKLKGGESFTYEAGSPKLPVKAVYVALPYGSVVSGISLVSSKEENIPGLYTIYPAQIQVPNDGKTMPVWTNPDSSVYFSSSPYPKDILVFTGEGYLKGAKIASFLVYPLRYIGKEKRISLVKEIRLSVSYYLSGSGGIRQDRIFLMDEMRKKELLRGLCVNPDEISSGNPEVVGSNNGLLMREFKPKDVPSLAGSPVQYVIITDDAMKWEFQRLADYKTKHGIPSVVRTISWIKANYRGGCDLAETIRNFIRDAYEKWGTRWVLLGGDVEFVPTRFVRWLGYFPTKDDPVATDYYYSCLDGNWNADGDKYFGEADGDSVDLYPEVEVGRAPTRNSLEARNFVNKMISYSLPVEKEYQMKFILLGTNIFSPNDCLGEILCEGVSSLTPDRFEKIKLYACSYNNAQRETVISKINQGAGLMYSQTHGNQYEITTQKGQLNRKDMDTLKNGNKLLFWIAVNCNSNAFDFDCFGEHFIRSQNGGVGYYASTRINFPGPQYEIDIVFYDSLLIRERNILGDVINLSKIAFIASSQNETIHRLLLFADCLLGDPGLSIWLYPPRLMNVSHPLVVPLSGSQFPVRVNSIFGPIPGARVTLKKGDEDYVSGITNQRGEVILPISPQSEGDYTVCVDEWHYIPYEGTSRVVSGGPFVTSIRQIVDDDSSGNSNGNKNSQIEGGETIELWITVKNTGIVLAEGVSGILKTLDRNISILDSIVFFGNISPNDSVVAAIPFRFNASVSIPDEEEVEFSLESNDIRGNRWEDKFILIAHSPNIFKVTHSIDDDNIPPTSGNGNGIPEKGEICGLKFILKNSGSGRGDIILAKLTSNDINVTILDSLVTVGNIEPRQEISHPPQNPIDELLFSVNPKKGANPPYRFSLSVSDMYGRVNVKDFAVMGVMTPTGVSYMPDSASIRLSWNKVESEVLKGYQVYRSDRSGGPYARVNNDIVGVAHYEDRGLLRGKLYFYVVSAVDTSNNESKFSSECMASCYPPYHSGFPKEVNDKVYGSAGIGNFDPTYPGMEVIQGTLAHRIYAWHSDGTGLLDSSGLFYEAPTDEGFWGSPALGDINGDGEIELLYGTFFGTPPKLYSFKRDGRNTQGFPKTLNGLGVFGSPVLFDLDKDGKPEVICATTSGTIFIWHGDGRGYRDTSGFFAQVPQPCWINTTPAVGDINGDGRAEIVVTSHECYDPYSGWLCGKIYVWDILGNLLRGFPVDVSSPIASSPALGDIDKSFSGLEIVFVAQNGNIFVMHNDTTIARGWPKNIEITESKSSPALADLDGDGHLEVLIADLNYMHVFKDDGTIFPNFPIAFNGAMNSSPAVGDIDGDGVLEILVGSWLYDFRIYAWNAFGKQALGFPIQTGLQLWATPTIADFNGDSRLCVVSGSYDNFLYIWKTSWNTPFPGKIEWETFHHDMWRTGLYGFSARVGIEEEELISYSMPLVTKVYQNAPNPLTHNSNINYQLSEKSNVSLKIYDITGKLVRTLIHEEKPAGRYSVRWDGKSQNGKNVSSGVYFYRFSAGSFSETKKMVVLR